METKYLYSFKTEHPSVIATDISKVKKMVKKDLRMLQIRSLFRPVLFAKFFTSVSFWKHTDWAGDWVGTRVPSNKRMHLNCVVIHYLRVSMDFLRTNVIGRV